MQNNMKSTIDNFMGIPTIQNETWGNIDKQIKRQNTANDLALISDIVGNVSQLFGRNNKPVDPSLVAQNPNLINNPPQYQNRSGLSSQAIWLIIGLVVLTLVGMVIIVVRK